MEKVPADVKRILGADSEAATLWKSLTPLARRDFVSWIESAKLPETRKRRVDSLPSRLKSGKRRPCCYAIVPMDFYKALGARPKAKAEWSTISANEKRDFTDWIESAKGKDEKKQRILKACQLLLKKKHRPE